MAALNVIALFCEDIRDESAGSHSIVGVMPDNLNVPELPAMIPKLCLYVRFNVGVEADLGEISLWLKNVDGAEREILKMEPTIMAEIQGAAKIAGMAIAGAMSKIIMGNFQLQGPGRIIALLRSSTLGEIVCGSLNIVSVKSV